MPNEPEVTENCEELGGNCRFLIGCRDEETYTADYKCPFWGKCCMPDYSACVKEGKKGSMFNADPNDDVCCAGLEKVQDSYPIEEGYGYPMNDLYPIGYPTKGCLLARGNFVCTKCGDGNCGLGENYCNCPKDCEEED